MESYKEDNFDKIAVLESQIGKISDASTNVKIGDLCHFLAYGGEKKFFHSKFL